MPEAPKPSSGGGGARPRRTAQGAVAASGGGGVQHGPPKRLNLLGFVQEIVLLVVGAMQKEGHLDKNSSGREEFRGRIGAAQRKSTGEFVQATALHPRSECDTICYMGLTNVSTDLGSLVLSSFDCFDKDRTLAQCTVEAPLTLDRDFAVTALQDSVSVRQ